MSLFRPKEHNHMPTKGVFCLVPTLLHTLDTDCRWPFCHFSIAWNNDFTRPGQDPVGSDGKLWGFMKSPKSHDMGSNQCLVSTCLDCVTYIYSWVNHCKPLVKLAYPDSTDMFHPGDMLLTLYNSNRTKIFNFETFRLMYITVSSLASFVTYVKKWGLILRKNQECWLLLKWKYLTNKIKTE